MAEMTEKDCIFCKLANGEIPTNTIYEDEDFNVFLDASPATKGHALIVPKKHYQDIYDLDEKTAAQIFPLAKKLAVHMTEVLGCDGFNIIQNNHEIAGQSVFHFHMHLIPRYEGGNKILEWDHQEYTQEQLQEISKQLHF